MRRDSIERNAIASVVFWMDTARAAYPDSRLFNPSISFDLKGGTAGIAMSGRHIRLNKTLLETHYKEMVEETIPHEVAHIVDWQIFKSVDDHGFTWRQIMAHFDKSPDVCHTMQNYKDWPYVYQCTDCNEKSAYSKRRHNKCRTGLTYICGDKGCKGIKVFVGMHGTELKDIDSALMETIAHRESIKPQNPSSILAQAALKHCFSS